VSATVISAGTIMLMQISDLTFPIYVMSYVAILSSTYVFSLLDLVWRLLTPYHCSEEDPVIQEYGNEDEEAAAFGACGGCGDNGDLEDYVDITEVQKDQACRALGSPGSAASHSRSTASTAGSKSSHHSSANSSFGSREI
jgi:hypothetical protein